MSRAGWLPFLGLLMMLGHACDVGSSSSGSAAVTLDPATLDEGDDSDVGAENLGPTPVDIHGRLHVSGTELRDASDEKVQLKGLSSMWLNWEDDGFAESLTGLEWLRNNWHLSVIRAAMGVEPDGAYLSDPERAKAQLEQVVDNAVAAGVYVIIDWHDHHATDHQPQAVAFFADIAAKYAGVPNVLYEPFNEPLKLDWSTQLKPYHEAVVAAIRRIEPDSVIILGTPNWSQDVELAAQDPLAGDNLMYTLHFYACDHGQWLINEANAALAKGAPLFVTEWGATKADGGLDGTVCELQAQAWHEWMKPRGIGWAAWKFDNCVPDSSCILSTNAPIDGGWRSQDLHGQGLYVRARMQEQ
ncbi:MAG TPA: glycoside hydrolase family 5 protein [Polyangiaceae bacterium]|jgi:endoglucanase